MTNAVTEGYALLRPQVAISVESAHRSWIARIFSGQPGFDPYSTSVSDVYHDLHGQASFTGKGIYDVQRLRRRCRRALPAERHPQPRSDRRRARPHRPHQCRVGGRLPGHLRRVFETQAPLGSRRLATPSVVVRCIRPAQNGRAAKNPLSALSRWKILDNLRRSLLEISVLLLLVSGWLVRPAPGALDHRGAAVWQLPAYADMLLSIIRAPERRFWKAFGKVLGGRFVESHRDTLLNLVFIPHQACLMADAIVRTLWREYVSGANLLEWETMAQSELGAGPRFGIFEQYLYISALVWLPFLFLVNPLPILVALICAFWVTAPLVAGWLNEALPEDAAMPPKDRDFLRETALRTWRYFADNCLRGASLAGARQRAGRPAACSAQYFADQSRVFVDGAVGGA